MRLLTVGEGVSLTLLPILRTLCLLLGCLVQPGNENLYLVLLCLVMLALLISLGHLLLSEEKQRSSGSGDQGT